MKSPDPILALKAALGLALIGTWLQPRDAEARQEPAPFHFTLRSWMEDVWFTAEDRTGTFGGRLGRDGMLARFGPVVDTEYSLDEISYLSSPIEDARWYASQNGARYKGGSLNYRDVLGSGDFKVSTGFLETWRFDFQYHLREALTASRRFVRLRLSKDYPESGLYGFAEANLQADKPDKDFSLGGGIRAEGIDAEISLTAVDGLNDLIYQTLVVWHGWADTALDYEKSPIALRGRASFEMWRDMRGEIYAGVISPNTIRAYRQLDPDVGFRQNEFFWYAAGLLEWSIKPDLKVAAFGNTVTAATERTQLAAGDQNDQFDLTERTSNFGFMWYAELTRRWTAYGWLARSGRIHDRQSVQDLTLRVDYRDRATNGQVLFRYKKPLGFMADLGFEINLRDVLSGDRTVPGGDTFDWNNVRLKLSIGRELSENIRAHIGFGTDLDGDQYATHRWFDGAFGRIVAYW